MTPTFDYVFLVFQEDQPSCQRNFKLSYILYQYVKLMHLLDLNQGLQYLEQVAHENQMLSEK